MLGRSMSCLVQQWPNQSTVFIFHFEEKIIQKKYVHAHFREITFTCHILYIYLYFKNIYINIQNIYI